MTTSCPECKAPLLMRRIEDLNVVEFEASCPSCGWAGVLRYLRCGGCHNNRLFTWAGESWLCICCGHLRRASQPRRAYKVRIDMYV